MSPPPNTEPRLARRGLGEVGALNTVLLLLPILLFLLVFLKNAWVSEDAYIMFRSIEQLAAGNGPRWNPHERVQVFTGPLWFWLLSLFRLACSDVFLNAIVASALLTLATVLVLRLTVGTTPAWAFLLLMLVCSKGFFDFTSSGLENPLGYLLTALYVHYYCRMHAPAPRTRLVPKLLLVLSLTLVCRHDLVTLLAIPTLFLVIGRWREMKIRTWLAAGLLTLLPLAAWSAFALVYYGSIIPNTAYAKLGSGVNRAALLAQGWNYFLASFRHDTITFIVLAAVIPASFLAREKHIRCLGFGVILNLVYVAAVGGDFMQGRFLSYAYLVAATCLVLARPRDKARNLVGALAAAALVVYAAAYPHVPLKTPLDFTNREMVLGVADERGHYFDTSSLRQYVTNHGGECFPAHRWSKEGLALAQSSHVVVEKNTVGYFGYWAGLDKIIVDPLALTDPLLARLHIAKTTHWRPGHFEREIPEGYIESLVSGENTIADPGISEFNERIKIITRSDNLLTRERIATIIAMNLGRYDRYVGQ